jgi:macrolide transport system ATP-binding/permease protein
MINLRNVTFEYGLQGSGVRALDNVTLNIAQGEFVAIVGASGSGKTTLMNVIGLMATPTSGEVAIAGVDATSLSADELAAVRNKKLGFIFQHFNLLARLSVLENVMLPAHYVEGPSASIGNYEQRALSLLAEFGLENHVGKAPALLSGGQKQRVAICRSLVLDPDVLLADEPTGALDSVNSAHVLDLLENLNTRGRTIVVITHDAKVAARAKSISDGQIISDVRNPEGKSKEKIQSTTGFDRPEDVWPKTSQPAYLSEVHLQDSVDKRKFFYFAETSFIAIKQAFANMSTHPVRSLLTVFGLAIGVSAIIFMLTLTSELRSAFKRFFDTKGGNSAWISVDGRESDRLGIARWQGLHIDSELPALTQFFAHYGQINPETGVESCQLRSRYQTGSGEIKGIDALSQFGDAEMKLAKGRFFKPSEVSESAISKVVILGKSAAESLFPFNTEAAAANEKYPIGEILSVEGDCPVALTLTVVGVLQEQDATFQNSLNASVWVPTRSLRSGGLSPYARRFVAVPNPGVSPIWLADSVKSYLTVLAQNKFPFRAMVPEKQIANINLMLSILGGLTVVVGGLCTLIGGIGVMNIMLVNIAERLREIGIRKAVGAKGFRIRNQFLVESTVLCSAAGIFGIAVGVLVSNLIMNVAAHFVPRYLDTKFVFDPLAVTIAIVSSVAAGFGFGLLPAKRAAAMDVVEALRQE